MDDLEEHSGELVEVVLAELRLDLGLHIFVPRKRASETATGRERAAEESLMTQKLRKLPLLRSARYVQALRFSSPIHRVFDCLRKPWGAFDRARDARFQMILGTPRLRPQRRSVPSAPRGLLTTRTLSRASDL